MTKCSYTVPDKNLSGDNFYGPNICKQSFVDWAWKTFGFQHDDWQDGWGWNDCCNTNKPLARTFNAIWLLSYSAEDYWNEDWKSNILHWGSRYARNQLDNLKARCGGEKANATTSDYWIFGAYVELYLLFFYSLNVVGRSGTLIHESRHLGGKGHDANFPKGSVYGEGKSGADSSWKYEGAWMYNALYLWWFYADGRRTTSALKDSAKQRAQMIIDNAFATHPGFTIA